MIERAVLCFADSDLAHWYSLKEVQATGDSQDTNETNHDTKDEEDDKEGDSDTEKKLLEWEFSDELLQHPKFVPAKIKKLANVVRSLQKLIEASESSSPIVVISKHRTPPLNVEVKSVLKANAAARNVTETEILAEMSAKLSLEPAAKMLARELGVQVQFCRSYTEIEALDNNNNGETLSDDEQPRVILLEHIDKAIEVEEQDYSILNQANIEAELPVGETNCSNDEHTTKNLTMEQVRQGASLAQKLKNAVGAVVFDTFPDKRHALLFEMLTRGTDGSKQVVLGPSLKPLVSRWNDLLKIPSSCRDRHGIAIIGGVGIERKLRLIDSLMDIVQTVFIAGQLAATFYLALTFKRLPYEARSSTFNPLIPAISKLLQKANRHGVDILLPAEFLVGEYALSDQEHIPADDEDDNDSHEEDSDEGVKAKRSKKKKKSLTEPAESDSPERPWSFDGDIAQVSLSDAENPDQGCWVSIHNIDENLLNHFVVVDGKTSLLEPTSDSQADEEMEAGSVDMDQANVLSEWRGVEWMDRAFDIGPTSVNSLISRIEEMGESTVVWVGPIGVTECREFETGSRKLLSFWEKRIQSHTMKSLLIAGESTVHWIEQQQADNGAIQIIDRCDANNADVLYHIIAAKPNPFLKLLARKA